MRRWRIHWRDYVTPGRINVAILDARTLSEALERLAWDLWRNSGMALHAWQPVKVEEISC